MSTRISTSTPVLDNESAAVVYAEVGGVVGVSRATTMTAKVPATVDVIGCAPWLDVVVAVV